jgi:hypothetical protein
MYRTIRQDINDYNRPVKLGRGLADAFEEAFEIIFGDKEADCFVLSDTEVARKGAWLYTASQALCAYSDARSGTRGRGEEGMQSELSIEGFSADTISKWITKMKKLLGDTPTAKRLKKFRSN